MTPFGYDAPVEILNDSPISESLQSPVEYIHEDLDNHTDDHPTPSDTPSLDLKQINQTIKRIDNAFQERVNRVKGGRINAK